MSKHDRFRVERVLQVYDRGEGPDDLEYWLSRPPLERFEAAEFLRQTIYGYDPLTVRVQRVLEVVERGGS